MGLLYRSETIVPTVFVPMDAENKCLTAVGLLFLDDSAPTTIPTIMHSITDLVLRCDCHLHSPFSGNF